MRFVRLGNTSLRDTDLALGTGALASRVDEKTSLAIMDCYIGEGGNFIDTANVYGRWNPGNLPLSEMMIGKWLSFHHLRDKVVLATKGAADNEGEKGKKRLSREEIRHDLHDSLKNLKTDYIDLYYLHQDDPTREVGEIMETMNELKREGLVRYFACSNWSAERMEEADRYAAAHGLAGFSADEIMFNLAKANEEAVLEATQSCVNENIFQYHQQTQRPITAYTSQAAGFFTLYREKDFMTSEKYSFPREFFFNEATMHRAQRVSMLKKMTGRSELEITLGYLYAQPFQVIPIVGPWKEEELKNSIRASEGRLSNEEREFLLGGEEF